MGDHDQLFKDVFRIPVNAAGELASVLPKEVLDVIELNSLELVPGDFVSKALNERFSDALFRARFKDGGTGFIWLLLEHQSTPDRWMVLRVLEKVTRAWEAWRRMDHAVKTLPPFICVVVHHGEAGWNVQTRLHDLVEGLEAVPALKRFVPNFEIVVDDLLHESDEALLGRPLGDYPKVVLWALRDARDAERLLAHLDEWGAALQQLATREPEDAAVVLRYVLGTTGVEALERFKQRIVEVAPATEKTMQTMAQGIEAQGRVIGKVESKAEDVLAVLEARGLAVTAEQRELVLACRDVATLDRWLRKAATARKAATLFAD